MKNKNSENTLTGLKRYKKGRSFADTLFGKMRYGKDLRNDMWVAIKENKKWFAQQKVSIKGDPVPEDLTNEIEIMQYIMSLNNIPNNILKLLDVVEDSVYIYLILELIDGGDFFGFIHSNHKKMELTNNYDGWELKMKKIFIDICQSVLWLHNNGVCHLDLSLENTLIKLEDKNNDTSGNIIKIIDFGLSKRFYNDNFILNNNRIGKPRCMSPEIYNLMSFDARYSDVWSIGIMLFMMILGIPPFNIPSNTQMIFRMIINGRIKDVIMFNKKSKLISNNALDLFIRIFKYQKYRIYLDNILKHPFCQI